MTVGGRNYCKTHAERLLLKEEQLLASRGSRGLALDIAVVLAILDGLAGVVVGFLMILLGLLSGSAQGSSILAGTVDPFLSYFASVLSFPSLQAIGIGFALMVLGVADMTAGYYMWGRSRAAAVLSVAVTSIAGGLIGGYLIVLALAGGFLYLYVASAIAKLAAIGYGWQHLRGSRRPPLELRGGQGPRR